MIGSDARLQRAFLSVANAGDTLTRALSIANNEFENSSALIEEVNKRLETTESQLAIQKNQWRDLGATIGAVVK